MTREGDLLVGSRTQIPRLYRQDLDELGSLGGVQQMFITQYGIPEPSTLLLAFSGGLALVAYRRRECNRSGWAVRDGGGVVSAKPAYSIYSLKDVAGHANCGDANYCHERGRYEAAKTVSANHGHRGGGQEDQSEQNDESRVENSHVAHYSDIPGPTSKTLIEASLLYRIASPH